GPQWSAGAVPPRPDTAQRGPVEGADGDPQLPERAVRRDDGGRTLLRQEAAGPVRLAAATAARSASTGRQAAQQGLPDCHQGRVGVAQSMNTASYGIGFVSGVPERTDPVVVGILQSLPNLLS